MFKDVNELKRLENLCPKYTGGLGPRFSKSFKERACGNYWDQIKKVWNFQGCSRKLMWNFHGSWFLVFDLGISTKDVSLKFAEFAWVKACLLMVN